MERSATFRRMSARGRSFLPAALGVITLTSLAPLIAWDASPELFPPRAHAFLAAVPLTMVALAYLIHQGTRRVASVEFVKAILTALAFVCWAINQLVPEYRYATLFNDVAVAAFVLDVVLVIVGWPTAVPLTSVAREPSRSPGRSPASSRSPRPER